MSNNKNLITDLKEWKFRQPPSYTELPIEDNPMSEFAAIVLNVIYSTPLPGKVHLVCVSDSALTDILDLDPQVSELEAFIELVAGKFLPAGGLTVCHRYGGHHFGVWAGQLGDGRAHILGEYINRKDETWLPQLKGSGETIYGRFGDGRCTLGSCLREMLASEACHHLGIPTVRAAAVVVSDEQTKWGSLGENKSRRERTAILLRLSKAWYRLGSFEILHKQGETQILRTLADFVIKHHFPDINEKDQDKYVKLYSELAYRNLDMVATWQGLGFTHGVMNTDNITILGLTLDYGPFAFMEQYDENYVCNALDFTGRYAFNKQPEIMLWNLKKFAEALEPILNEDQMKEVNELYPILEKYVADKILRTYLLKLGITDIQEGDIKLVDDLMRMMQETAADLTCTFRQMAEVNIDQLKDASVCESHWSLAKIYKAKDWGQWVKTYTDRLQTSKVNDEQRRSITRRVNPVYVPRNWILQEAISYADNYDFHKVRLLLKIFENPYEVNEEAEKLGYSSQPPSWSRDLVFKCSYRSKSTPFEDMFGTTTDNYGPFGEEFNAKMYIPEK